MSKQSYKTDVRLGEVYVEPYTGTTGKAVAVSFYEHACERVTLRYSHDGDVKEATFDAGELVPRGSDAKLATDKTGGPSRGSDPRRSL